MSIPRTSGIYQILCVPTGKIYIGSAVLISDRWAVHLSMLKRGIHHSRHLQNAWNKYSEQAFTFSILEETTIDQLRDREQFYISLTKATDRRYGFNLRRVASAKPVTTERIKQAHLFHHSIGIKFPYSQERADRTAAFWTGRKHRPESIKKMSDTKRGRPEHPNAARAKVEATSKEYIVTDPQGNEHEIKNLNGFCRERGLTAQLMHRCAKGQERQHKGWKCRYR